MNNKKKRNEEKKLGLFQWIIYAGLIPVIIGSVIIIFVLDLTGIDVLSHAKSIPVVGSIIEKNEVEKEELLLQEQHEKELNGMKEQLENEKTKVIEMESQLKAQEKELETLKGDKETLENELIKLKDEKASTEQDLQTVIKTYENMSPKNAAAIISEMEDKDAIKLLENMKDTSLTQILEKMDAEAAAKFTSILMP